jgi:hypothetical protein
MAAKPMKNLDAKARAALKPSQFGLPGKAKGAEAKKEPGNYPMPDARHAALAVGLAGKYASPAEAAQVAATAGKKFPAAVKGVKKAVARKMAAKKGAPPFPMK